MGYPRFPDRRPFMIKVYAHRGYSGLYPENTMLAFSKALEAGADGIENDVHLSKDGEVMIMHDESLARTAGLNEYIFNMTRSELEKISAGKTMNDRFGFTPVPSLEEYLCFMKDHKDKVTNIELKTAPVYYPGLEEKVMNLVARYSLENNVIYSSFNWLSVIKMKRIDPSCRVGLLFSGMKLYNQAPIMRQLDIDFFHPDFHDIDEAFVKGMHAEERGVNVWTVNEMEDIEKAASLHVDGIITNFPEKALSLVRR